MDDRLLLGGLLRVFGIDGLQERIGAVAVAREVLAPHVELADLLGIEDGLDGRALGNDAWEFTLREGIRFHDGRPFTADDIAFTIERIPGVTGPGASYSTHVRPVKRIEIVDARTILIRHSNWSPINGRRGQIEDNVKVVDVSDAGDWSEVRVWYAPLQALGGSHWPVQGFIYPAAPKKGEKLLRDAGKPTQAAPSRDPIGDIIKRKMRW